MAFDPAWERAHAAREWGANHEPRVMAFIGDKLSGMDRPMSDVSVLDLGTGFGAQAFEMARRGLRVVGVDASPSAIARCHARLASRAVALPNLSFEVADVGNLPFPSETFDAVVDCVTLQHVGKHDIGIAVAEAMRMLKAGGWFFSLAATSRYDLTVSAPQQPFTMTSDDARNLYSNLDELVIEVADHINARGRQISWWQITGRKRQSN